MHQVRAFLLVVAAAAAPAASAQTLPPAAFYAGIGGGYVDADFGRQDVNAVGTSQVFENGVLVATGEAAGPARLAMPDASGLAPMLQAGYFRQVPGSGWVWGAKFSYAYLGREASLRDVRMPQEGEFTSVTTGDVTPFTGNAIAQGYRTSVADQLALLPYAGRSYDRGFFYLGLGPTLSRTRTEIDGLVGFADINGVRQDISGPPQNFSSSEWVWGGAAIIGVTHFLSEKLFIDASYSYGRTQRYRDDYASEFVNPDENGRVTAGTLVGDSSGRLVTQAITVTLNWAF
jgi:opacity protein-like surface antigen